MRYHPRMGAPVPCIVLAFEEGRIAVSLSAVARVLQGGEIADLEANGVPFHDLAGVLAWRLRGGSDGDGLLAPAGSGLPCAWRNLAISGVAHLDPDTFSILPGELFRLEQPVRVSAESPPLYWLQELPRPAREVR